MISISSRFHPLLSTLKKMIQKSSEQFIAGTRQVFFFDVSKTWSVLSNSIVTTFNVGNYEDQLSSKEVSSVTDKLLRYVVNT